MSRKKQKRNIRDTLVLTKYLCSLFGYQTLKKFRNSFKEVPEGYAEDGRSYFLHHIISLGEKVKISPSKLEEYDANIRSYVEKISEHRPEPISLKYFQYLAVLFTEIYLDKYFQNPIGLMNKINQYLEDSGEMDTDLYFSSNDLRKLAFWMATGSGKTLIFHINYLQFMKYNECPNAIKYDNILLITPSEGLSHQHMKEMQLSGIMSSIFQSKAGQYFETQAEKEVKVIDIHKFTEEKKGSGVTIDIDEFGTQNIIFVDEGHKGSGGKKWRKFRETVSRDGFTFEYSATFSQAIESAKSSKLKNEYSKAIVFDYSYPYFYADGYGKDYRILNLKKESYDSQDVLLLSNAITYYEQKLLFESKPDMTKEYNIENPLWIIVGARVQPKKNAVETLDISDILQVAIHLKKILENEGNWAVDTIERILRGKSGILDQYNRDIFSREYPESRLDFIRERFAGKDHSQMAKEIYLDMLRRVFHVRDSAPLHLENLKGVSGEIGLRAGASTDHFGVIYIGDTSSFIKHARENGIDVIPSEFSTSLFGTIDSPHSKVNILIGAKKFMEGWNSWRVSTMGLLRVGRNEGTQIIQLFGRGVRLKGKNFSLKRSGFVDPNPPRHIHILETLGIFGIKADYMDKFREYLESEDIREPPKISRKIPVKLEKDFLKNNLLIPKLDSEGFYREIVFEIPDEEEIIPVVDLNPKVELMFSRENSTISAVTYRQPRTINDEILDMLDWNRIYFNLLDYRYSRGWNNILFTKESLKDIMKARRYTLYCPENVASPKRFEELRMTEEAVISVLKSHVREAYNKKRRKWAEDNTEMEKLTEEHENILKEYSVSIPETEASLIDEIETIIDRKMEELLSGNLSSPYLQNIYFKRHIYQPLLSRSGKGNVKISPDGLNEGERRFIEHLKKFVESNPPELNNKDIFVLRNRARKGVGFYETQGFYPDFIIWVKEGNFQRIIFADPHGMAHMYAGKDKEKVGLSKRIKRIENALKARGYDNLALDSYIISVSRYSRALFGMDRKKLESEHHILFQVDDPDYLRKMFSTPVSKGEI